MSDLKQRIYEVAKDFQLINFATITGDGKPWVRYVVARADDEEGGDDGGGDDEDFDENDLYGMM